MEEAVQTAVQSQVTGYTNLRVKQITEEGDTTLSIQGKDVFISLPTGSGKAFATTHCQQCQT